MKKIIIILSSLIAVFLIGGYLFLNGTVKEYTQTVSMAGITSDAEVVFDSYGIPHIYAQTNTEAFRILGYVQASDRLFQLELLRRIGSGRLAEILGDSLIKTDKFLRTIGLNENAKRAALAFEEEAPQDIKENVHAFLEGINQYIKEGKTPIEFRLIGIEKSEFTVTDIYRILGYMGFGFSMELKNEPILDWINRNIGSQYVKELSIDVRIPDNKIPSQQMDTAYFDNTSLSHHINEVIESLPVPIFYGSNSWVISGKKSKSGKVLFANDTHIGFSQPSIWYEAHIETPDIKLYGNFLAGIPFPLVGHNAHHSWGLTIFPNDAADLYRETIKEDQVMFKNKWTNLEYREETIQIKGGTEETFTVTSTPHGPIISALPAMAPEFENPVSMWYTSNKITDRKLYAIGRLSMSNSFDDLEKAARDIDSPGLNIMYGDIEGNIGWYGSSFLIKRPDHVQSKLVLDGASGKDEPLGFYDFKDNPRNINPENGYVISANNQPDSINGIIHPGYYYAGARYKAINNAISKKDDWDINSMAELITSDKSPFYPENAKVMASLITNPTVDQQAVLHQLLTWNGEHSTSDLGPVIYYKWLYHILHNSLADEITQRRFDLLLTNSMYLHAVPDLLRNDTSVWWDNIETNETETRTDIVRLAFEQTFNELQTQLGNDISAWNWGKVHFIEHPHLIGKMKPLDLLFNVGPFAASGGEEVINKIAFQLNADGVYISKSGPAMRILLDFADVENSVSINPTGASGNFMNTHYDDQAQMYVNGEFRKQKMNKADILDNKEGIWIFVPVN
ncbi:MAG: penicillin amidase [Dokdonia sp.]|jgi:penicillin amidase